ncbi:MAG: cache domain-containing protein [candidate division WOR-3 bacterium]
MRVGITGKFILSFLLVIALIGALAIWIGIHFIADGIVKQAQSKVKSDLNVAREIYQENLGDIKDVIRFASLRFFLQEGILGGNLKAIGLELAKIRREEFLDILTLTDSLGRVLVSARNPKRYGDKVDNDLVKWVLEKKEVAQATTIIPREEILRESEELVQLAEIEIVPTPRAKLKEGGKLNAGMFLLACAPIFTQDGRFLGTLYGGRILNQNYFLVDRIKDLVFKGEVYKGKEIGTATIFQGDVRIATNVRFPDGRRAIGTRVAENVYTEVLEKGRAFIDQAFVVQDWYITAYEPIRNINGKTVGILYVGLRAEKFFDMKKKAIVTFVSIMLIGVSIAVLVSFLLARSILLPLKKIISASRQIARGDFSQRVEVKTKDELREVSESFNFMASSLKEREEKLKEATSQQLMRSERLATLGQLAAGVAHEINNPIAGILTYIRLIQKKLAKMGNTGDGEMKRYLAIMEKETARCGTIVRNLLDFARQSEPNLKPVDIHHVLDESLELLAHKLRLQNVEVEKHYGPCPQITADFAQLQQTFMNIIINACEAMEKGGKLTITTQRKDNMVEIEFADTGKGIPPENLPRIFDPFFTTKPKGTGLGLSVVYGIVSRHRGQINVKSEVNKGTIFTISLPVSIE